MYFKNRGIAAIVTVVLLILIMVGAVLAIWVYLIPTLEKVGGADSDVVRLNVESSGGYTAYDEDTGYVFVQVSRGVDKSKLFGLNVIFNVEGNSVKFKTTEVPSQGEKGIFVFDFTREGISGVPESVKVSPIFSENSVDRSGLIVSEVNIPNVKVHLTPEEWAQAKIDSRKNYLNEDVEGTVIDSCKDDFEAGNSYTLVSDLNVSGNCFEVNADDVVLNLHRRIINSDGSGVAVNITGKRVSVKNGIFLDYQTGIIVNGDLGEDNLTINNNRFENVVTGVSLIRTNNNYFYSNVFTDRNQGVGFLLQDSYNNTFQYNDACGVLTGVQCNPSGLVGFDYTNNIFGGNSFVTTYSCGLVPGVDYTSC